MFRYLMGFCCSVRDTEGKTQALESLTIMKKPEDGRGKALKDLDSIEMNKDFKLD